MKSILLYNRFAPSGFTRRIDECLLHLQRWIQTPVLRWNIFQSLPLPVKCSRLKLIVRANHLYSPLTRDREKCDPLTLTALVFLCRGKENILVCKALLLWIISVLPPWVWAIPDCFRVQYKFLYYDEPCFLKTGTVPSVRQPGQGWECMDRKEEESPACSRLYHGEAMAKLIKASFSPTVWSVCLPVPLFFFCQRPTGCVDRAGTSNMQRQRGRDIFQLWKTERKRKGGMGRRWEGMGHLGIFVSNMKGHLCWGARGAQRIDCVLHVFTGDVWIFD